MTENKNGAFYVSITRNNSQIKKDRGIALAEKAELVFKRKIEDLQMEIKEIERDRASMLDLSPANAMNLTVVSDFNAETFLAKDVELGIKKRELSIKLEILEERYKYLFVDELKAEE